MGFVPKRQAAEFELGGDLAGQRPRPIGVVVADHPHQRPAPRQITQALGVVGRQPRLGFAIVEGVAQQDHNRGGQRLDLGGQALERLAGVVGRQHLAAGGIGAALLQVQVGDHQGALGRQP